MVVKYGNLYHHISCLQKGQLPQEKLRLKFCKYILGFNSRATNLAVRGETGRYPLLLQILANMFKYLMYIKSSKNDLLTETFQLSENLSSSGIDSWVNSIIRLMLILEVILKKIYLKVLK